MKEATGELNMTVITVIAIGAIAALFYVFVWPMIQRTIVQQTCNAYGTNSSGSPYKAVKITSGGAAGNEKTATWKCCPGGVNGSTCVDAS